MKKVEAKEAVADLNRMKNDLDDSRAKLEEMKDIREREDQDVNEEEPVIEEEEFLLLKKISDLKLRYRARFDCLQDLRSDVSYCENLVNQCRQRLISEFEGWYADCFMPVAEESEKTEDSKSDDSKKGQKSVRIVEDEQEKFDRIQLELLMDNPESVPFYNAKLQTERRQLYTGSGTGKRKPGGVVSSVRNKPPTTLTVK